jgi:two-component system, chemotaxis family, CheB/CheR fusion protein
VAVDVRARTSGVVTVVEAVEHGLVERVAAILEAHEGRQRSAYKLATLGRRVARRCAAGGLSLAAYVDLLEESALERAVLVQDLHLGVTSFFRDPAAFAALGVLLAAQLEGKPDAAPVRAWCAGCATGEEAYSLAMLLHEVANKLDRSFEVRIFATDTDEHALRRARAGLFDPVAALALPPEYLEHFELEDRCYRIKDELRRTVVFGQHDMLVDSPFRRLDLVSCRNVLIYLEPAVQQELLARFHSGLISGGTLLLGPSESAGLESELFVALDRQHRLYRRIDGAAALFGPFSPAGPTRQELEARVAELVARHRELEADNAGLRQENLALRRRLATLETTSDAAPWPR